MLDASALDAWARGHLGMSSWYALAWELQLTFLVPPGTRNEALLLRPDAADLINVLLAAPYVVTAASPDESTRQQLVDVQEQARVYDPHSVLTAYLARTRGWPVLSADPARLHRITPNVEVEPL